MNIQEQTARHLADLDIISRRIARKKMGDLSGKVVHHINGNRFDNRIENLLVVEVKQNGR